MEYRSVRLLLISSLLFVSSLFTAGCAQMTGMMSSDDTAGIPDLTEPALPDE